MSYAVAYSLFNYKLDAPSKGHAYDNLRLVRAFEQGLDPKSSEAGFILTHVDMVKESGALINGVVRILNNIEKGKDRAEVNDAYREVLAAMTKIEDNMEGMPLAHLNLPKIHAIVRMLIVHDRNVEELEAIGVPVLPGFHLWYHFAVNVPQWRRL